MQPKKASIVLAIIAVWAILIALAKSYLAPEIAANTVSQLDSGSVAFSDSTFMNSAFGMTTLAITFIAVIILARVLRTQ